MNRSRANTEQPTQEQIDWALSRLQQEYPSQCYPIINALYHKIPAQTPFAPHKNSSNRATCIDEQRWSSPSSNSRYSNNINRNSISSYNNSASNNKTHNNSAYNNIANSSNSNSLGLFSFSPDPHLPLFQHEIDQQQQEDHKHEDQEGYDTPQNMFSFAQNNNSVIENSLVRNSNLLESLQPIPSKYEVRKEHKRKRINPQIKVKPEVYDHKTHQTGLEGKLKHEREPVLSDREEEYNSAIRKFMALKASAANRQFRLYVYKLVPRFNDKKDLTKYFQKRLAAKAYCERGYGMNKVKQTFFEKGGPVNLESKRYKTVVNAVTTETYRRFELVASQEMKLSVRPLTSPELRSLQSVLLNAEGNFRPEEYNCFRKFVKYSFGIGSVSIYEHQVIDFYVRVLQHLRQKLREGERGEEVVLIDNSNGRLKEGTSSSNKFKSRSNKGSSNKGRSMASSRVKEEEPGWIDYEEEEGAGDDSLCVEGLNLSNLFDFEEPIAELEDQKH